MFEPGEQVICINNKDSEFEYASRYLVEGAVYTVEDHSPLSFIQRTGQIKEHPAIRLMEFQQRIGKYKIGFSDWRFSRYKNPSVEMFKEMCKNTKIEV